MKKDTERDYRLDFCRGVALILIFIDHVPGNPASHWTLRKWAFCDAAEVFVLISGISSYLAYGSKLDKFGFTGCCKAVAQRLTRIYGAHLLLFFSAALFVRLASAYFARVDYVDFLQVKLLFADPRHYVPAALTLSYLPKYLDILPLYLILLGAAPLIIYVVKRDPWLALIFSGLVYVMVRATGFNLSAGHDGMGWNFNPFAWQLIYTIGIVTGHFSKQDAATDNLRNRYRWAWFTLAAGFAMFALAAAGPWTASEESRALFSYYLWPAEKTFLSPLRVANVVALLYLFVFFVPKQAKFFSGRIASVFLACGRNSLPVYGVGVVLSVAGYVVLSESDSPNMAVVAINLFGIMSLFMLACALDWRRKNALTQPALAARFYGTELVRRFVG
ncbi:MAG TPA: OpgC domain-containing protein [Candidatus Binataceae bacterium]|nr:OpgC domain-containing protein [Candidatus Binataceae bacterium]